MLQPLLKLQAQPVLPPPKVEARRRGKGSEGRPRPPGRGGGRPDAARGAKGRGARQRTVRRRTR